MRLHTPRYTIRLRLTLLYGGVFLLCGAALLGAAYLLVRQTTEAPVFSVTTTPRGAAVSGPHGQVGLELFQVKGPLGNSTMHAPAPLGGKRLVAPAAGGAPGPLEASRGAPSLGPPLVIPLAQAQKQAKELSTLAVAQRNEAQRQANQLRTLAVEQHNEELHRLLIILGIALAVMAIISMGLGWLVAGRALRPLQTITKAARAISATNLHKRLSLRGPDDELRELGATFDELLERLERSFEAQRQFVANASHELRTPLTLERATIEVALADPTATTADLRAACERVLAIGEQQERTIDAMLTLARGERGLDRRTMFDLKAPVADVVDSRRAEIERRGLSLESALSSALTSGDRRLVERLAANLLDNAIQHNKHGGWIKLSTSFGSHTAVLRIANSGQVVPPGEVEQLFEPFRRQGPARSARGEGHGLGLSIVTAVATAHGAKVSARASPRGGLEVEVRFPAATRFDGRSAADEPNGGGRAGRVLATPPSAN